jgi:hypothetical protein
MSIYIPYTYLIGWSEHNKYYYGVRYAMNCNPNDLWLSYFTSSKHVKEFRKNHGEPDILEVRKTFKDAKSAIRWEENVLKRMNVLHRSDFLNKNISGAILLTDEMKELISKTNTGNKYWLGKKHTEETKIKMRRPKTEEEKKNMSFSKQKNIEKTREVARKNGMIAAEKSKGISPSKEIAKRRAEGKIGLKYTKVQCPYCNKLIANNTLKRWHGDNCKFNPKANYSSGQII